MWAKPKELIVYFLEILSFDQFRYWHGKDPDVGL
jgi:hypothetical protein